MELEIFEALIAANVPAEQARLAAQSIERAIDRRYELHSKQLATRGDVELVRKEVGDVRTNMQKWKPVCCVRWPKCKGGL